MIILHRSPVIVLNEITITQLEALLSYMYVGEVELKHSELEIFSWFLEDSLVTGSSLGKARPLIRKHSAALMSSSRSFCLTSTSPTYI